MDKACAGKVAIVTGASRGIGAAIARRLASEGARVAVSARTLEPNDRVKGSLRETADEIAAKVLQNRTASGGIASSNGAVVDNSEE